jgi:hypothetical protein
MKLPRKGAEGGSVLVPEPYNRPLRYPAYSERVADKVLIGYRNWRSTMSGHPECDGMIGVGLVSEFDGLRDFMNACRGALSIQWSAADTVQEPRGLQTSSAIPLKNAMANTGRNWCSCSQFIASAGSMSMTIPP